MRRIFLFISFALLSTVFATAQDVTNPVTSATTNETPKNDEKPDKIAMFPGGLDAYVRYLTANLQYPPKALRDKTEGTVVLEFIVDKTGEIRNVKVLHSLSPECDKEAIRMVKAMPRWFAAEKDGKKVDCRYTCPVTFKL